MAEKDLRDENFQSNLSLYIDYYYVPHYIDTTNQKYILRLIKGYNNVYSYFAPSFGNLYM